MTDSPREDHGTDEYVSAANQLPFTEPFDKRLVIGCVVVGVLALAGLCALLWGGYGAVTRFVH